MIRRSFPIAVVAVVLSLLLHGLGFGVSTLPEIVVVEDAPKEDVVELGNSFEELAESATEPEEPEPAPQPEPEAESVPEPEPEPAPAPEPVEAEIPTSEALVASSNPQEGVTPDLGVSETADPNLTEPVAAGEAEAAEPEVAEPVEAPVEPPVAETEATPETTEPPAPAETVEPVETTIVEVAPVEAAEPEPQPSEQIAALPAPAAPATPVAPAPVPSVVPVVPIAPEVAETDTPPETVAPVPNETEVQPSTEETEGSTLAVASSIRPRAPGRRPDVPDTPVTADSLSFPTQRIESPITAYQRDRSNPGAISGGIANGQAYSPGTGNSNRTNYAGIVLTHLNRAGIVRVNTPGWASVMFEIRPDGSLAWVDIIDGSGAEEVYTAARAQVRAAAPFPPPPGGKTRRLSFSYRSD
ncbi:MAG: TonB family protein [Paracoccaceae bacterium]